MMRIHTRKNSTSTGSFLVPIIFLIILGIRSLFGADSVAAQDLEPRSYANIPVGLNFLVVGYSFAEGGVATDPSLPLQNAEIEAQGAVLAYARSIELLGNSAKVDVILPYSSLSGTAEFNGEPVAREVSGVGDPRLRFSSNFLGAPSLSMKEFESYVPDTIVGGSLQVLLPLGQYDDEKLVNVGNNRFMIKPEIGLSKALAPFTLELAAAASFYTDNKDFLGDKRREQEPLYSLQTHLLYDFGRGIWAGIDGTYYTGGRTTVDGKKSNDLQENSRVGLTFSMPFDRKNSVKVFMSKGVSTRTGGDFNLFGTALQHRWGGGL